MPPERESSATQTQADAALRDASAIARRIAADEAAADAGRAAYQLSGLPLLEPDPSFAALLEPGERLHAVHRLAMLETGSSGDQPTLPRGGTLLLTSRRIVHAGEATQAWELSEVVDMLVALERLLLIGLRDGSDLHLEVDLPRLLRVQLAAAVAALRGSPSVNEAV